MEWAKFTKFFGFLKYWPARGLFYIFVGLITWDQVRRFLWLCPVSFGCCCWWFRCCAAAAADSAVGQSSALWFLTFFPPGDVGCSPVPPFPRATAVYACRDAVQSRIIAGPALRRNKA